MGSVGNCVGQLDQSNVGQVGQRGTGSSEKCVGQLDQSNVGQVGQHGTGAGVAEQSICPVDSFDQGDKSIYGHGGQRGTGVAERSVGQVGQPIVSQVGQHGQVLQSKYYFRGRDLTSQLPRETVGILFIAEPSVGQEQQFKKFQSQYYMIKITHTFV